MDLQNWIDQSAERRPFRQAVHTILVAITRSDALKTTMVMKGGLLLALAYASTRYTRDIDFSTAQTLAEFDRSAFVSALDTALLQAVNSLDYGLDCRVQRHRQKPPQADATFPTLEIAVGYAYKHERSAHRRLLNNNSPHIVEIDYSLNEPSWETDLFELGKGQQLRIYSFTDLVAEKFRALLQQAARNRRRRQDVYDLHFLLAHHPRATDATTRHKIRDTLINKAKSRGLEVGKDSLANPEIIRLSQAEYAQLAQEIEEPLPDFATAYAAIRAYYESLPWKNIC